MTTPTTNPVPSTAPQDLLFNAEKLDQAVNSSALTYIDRLGVTRKSLAGLSADAALGVAGGVYASTAAGLAATPNGRYFNVVSGNPAEYLILYLNSGGTAVEQKRHPSTFDLTAIHTVLDPLPAQVASHGTSITTISGNVATQAAQISSLGTSVSTINGEIVPIRQDVAEASSYIAATQEEVRSYPVADDNASNLAWGVLDQASRISMAVTTDGSVQLGATLVREIGESNSLDVAFAVEDDVGRVAFAVTNAGRVLMPLNDDAATQRGTLIEASGDVVLVAGDTEVEITDTGNNAAPSFLGLDRVKYVSTRRRGTRAEYSSSLTGADVRRHYVDPGVYEQVIITGQSLAQGGANAAITTTPPYPSSAYRFSNGPVGNGAEAITSILAPLREEVFETISTGFARKLLSVVPDRKVLVTGQAYGGAAYAALKKGGTLPCFAQCISQVTSGAAQDGGAQVRAVFVIHGEQDGIDASTTYAADLVEWLDDFTDDVRAANDQRGGLVMLLCQVSSAAGYKTAPNRDQFTTPFAQLQASEADPRIFMVCPKYFLTYVDGSHIDAVSERLLGEYYGKVYRKVVVEGQDWRPVSPASFNVVGSTVVINCHVPVAPLVIDTTAVSNPGTFGFSLTNSGSVNLTGGSITGPKQVTMTLSAPPPAGSVLSYAFHNGTYPNSGPTQGARGNLRDSDTETSTYTGAALRNWCVSFKHTF